MKIARQILAVTVIMVMAVFGCASGPKATVVELENKGTSMGVATPEWIRTYTAYGISRVQAQPEFRDKYCIIGEESGVNRQFVLAWADNFSAQQRIGAMLRTTIASEYKAREQGVGQSQGGANSSQAEGTSSGEFNQQIDNVINAIVNVSYSGAQREADWWSLRRRYDPDNKEVYSDEYTAYVLYTIPKAELNRQVARALETSVNADSALYDITIDMARQILQNGLAMWGGTSITNETSNTAAAPAQAQTSTGPKVGTYTFWPRIQASMESLPQQAYIYKVVVRGNNMLVYIGNSERGQNTSYYGLAGGWIYGGTLTNLDSPYQEWETVGIMGTENANEGAVILSFANVTGNRFSLERISGRLHIFEEIILDEPD